MAPDGIGRGTRPGSLDQIRPETFSSRLPWVAVLASLVACRSAEPPSPVGLTMIPAVPGDPAAATVNGVTLHYVERGKGPPIVFVHGSLVDYREWAPVAESLSTTYRTIIYSRRYNYPNDNPLTGKNHSAAVEAEDLAALIRERGLGAAHIVGVSYGAYTALLLARRNPELVRSLVLVEPPLIRWAPELPGGRKLYDEFLTGTWQPAGRAFERGDTAEALRVTLDYFLGKGAAGRIPAEMRTALLSNVREWQALTTSRDAFPDIARDEVDRINKPSLMISGGRSYPILRLTDEELERHLKHGRRIIIPDGTHDVCSERPQLCLGFIRTFLAGQ